MDPSAGSSVKRESDLLYEKWITRKQEREKEGGRGTKKENNETVKKMSTGKERERFEQKNAEIGKWKPKKNGTECE